MKIHLRSITIAFLSAKKVPKIKTRVRTNPEYKYAYEEDVEGFLKKCKKIGIHVYVYGTCELDKKQKEAVDNLISLGLVKKYLHVNDVSDFKSFIDNNDISFNNSHFVIKSLCEVEKLHKIGVKVYPEIGDRKKVHYWYCKEIEQSNYYAEDIIQRAKTFLTSNPTKSLKELSVHMHIWFGVPDKLFFTTR